MAAASEKNSASAATILMVEDDTSVRFAVRGFLTRRGYQVLEASSRAEAQQALDQTVPDTVLLDYNLPDTTGLELLRTFKRLDATLPVVLLTGHGSIPLAVEAIQEGADHFLTKPVEMAALVVLIERLLAQRRSQHRVMAEEARESRHRADPFLGESPAIRELARQAERLLGSSSPVLLRGETGTGKGVLAQWLHTHGPRNQEAFVDINCAGLSREFLESQLFGHDKGAFTGAATAKPGLLEVAHHGSLFLDEIGDMETSIQPKLLKVLEEKRFRRLGEVKERQVDVRLIAATRQDLEAAMASGSFRDDLYYRISSLELMVPPLRERGRDVVMLARHLLPRLAAECGTPPRSLSADAEAALLSHSWPGNVRELRNGLERALLLAEPGDVLSGDQILSVLASGRASRAPARQGRSLRLEDVERDHLASVLASTAGDVRQAAVLLGLSRSALYERIKKHGISLR